MGQGFDSMIMMKEVTNSTVNIAIREGILMYYPLSHIIILQDIRYK